MSFEIKKRCARCGKRLKKGGVFFLLKAELISSYDGYINENSEDLESRIEQIAEQVEGLSEQEIAEQVCKKIEYYVCLDCRDSIDKYLEIKEIS